MPPANRPADVRPAARPTAPCPARPTRPRALRTIAALALREMATAYGASPGGWLWAVAEPVAAIGLLSFAFSLAFLAPPLGSSFPLFYATGFLPYFLFHDLAQKTAGAIRYSKPLLSFGAVTCHDVLAARFLLNLLAHVMVFVVVMATILAVVGSAAMPEPGGMALALAMAAALAAGVGTLNACLFLLFPAWERLFSIALRPLFIASGVLFLFEAVPEAYQPLLWANPLFHVTGVMRAAVYPGYAPHYPSPVFVFGVAAALLLLGLLLIDRFQDRLRDR